MKWMLSLVMTVGLTVLITNPVRSQDPELAPEPRDAAAMVATPALEEEPKAVEAPKIDSGDTAWMLTSTALVMLMVPGLALFYGGMVRRKNVLATMMQSMVALAIVGVYWIAIGYCLAFGKPLLGGLIGWNPDLIFLKGIEVDQVLPNNAIPIYVHVMFQGMFAIITPALISGALAERIRFGPYCLFIILWVTLVYCPLAHMVWAMNWWGPIQVTEVVDGVSKVVTKDAGTAMVGLLGKMGALDFAGGTVVHIAAGLSALAAIVVLRKRIGYPEHSFHPNSMVLTLLGAGLLWFGWFGFNGGSATASGKLASSAFAATQAAAAAAALSWMLVEWCHRGKPTALGLASGVVAGLVAVTPAAGYIYIWGGLAIGLIAGVVCYIAVTLKPFFKYDDSLDAFGVHGVGGFLGAVLTGVFCYLSVNSLGAEGMLASIFGKNPGNMMAQTWIQLKAATFSVVFAFLISALMVKVIDEVFGFIAEPRFEIDGLDRAEHGEVGFDLGLALESSPVMQEAPKAASVPPDGQRRFTVVVDGPSAGQLRDAWSKLCQTSAEPPSPHFKAVYPNMTTLEGNRFHFRGGDPHQMSDNLRKLFQSSLQNYDVKARVED